MNLTDNEIRLRCLELALEHGLSTDKVAVANEFARFVFNSSAVPRRRRKS